MSSSEFHQNYSDIIFTAPNRIPEHQVINLEKFLKRFFPRHDLFISGLNIQDVRNCLKSKYGNDAKCFEEQGILLDFDVTKIKYYQQDVGIDGPKHKQITDPVYVVRYSKMDILFNGYHRTFYNLIQGQKLIKAYYLTL